MDSNSLGIIVGLGGAILGAGLGFFFGRLDRLGKMKFLQAKLSNFQHPFRDEDFEVMTLFWLNADIYNSSRDPKILRDVYLIIVQRGKTISKMHLLDNKPD